MSRVLVRAGAVAVALLATLPAGSARADEGTAITYVQHDRGSVSLLVDVPPDVEVDLASVAVTIGGEQTEAEAVPAASTSVVRRTSVLAIDTSNSMRGDRFEAAKSAALAYLDAIPADVNVGIVTFDSNVSTPLQPTTDRDAARDVVAELGLSRQTRLYDGVLAAVGMAGEDGQRSVLVLSDGADTSPTDLSTVESAIADAGVLTDVVSLDQAGAVEPLTRLAEAGEGRVISASSDALAGTFSAEADVLARQVLVTAPVPDAVTTTDATITVGLQAGADELTAEIYAPVRARAEEEAAPPPVAAVAGPGIQVPLYAVYAGVGLLGTGVLGFVLLVAMGSRKVPEMSAVDRVVQYAAAGGRGGAPVPDRAADQPLSQARDAAAGVLARNKTLEDRIARKLTAAGSGFLPSEWLLLHIGVAVGVALVGTLLTGGNVLMGLVFLLLGLLGPWAYLGFKKKRRYRAFSTQLPDTLQLISGSLAAGLSLAQSIDTIVREGGEPMKTEFRRVLVETRLGVSIEDALEGVAERFDSKDFTWVVMAIRIQRQVGGNLAELLNTVAATIREREYLRRQVLSLSAEGRLSAWVLGCLPPGFSAYLLLTQPDYFGVMFSDPRGWLMLGACVVMLAVGAFWMSKLVKVEV